MRDAIFALHKNMLFDYYLTRTDLIDAIGNLRAIVALQSFNVEEVERVSDIIVHVTGYLKVLVRTNSDFKYVDTRITMSIYYDVKDKLGNKQLLANEFFENQLNDFSDTREVLDSDRTILAGKPALELSEDYSTLKDSLSPNDEAKYPDLPKALRMDLELILKKYINNKAFKLRYDNFFNRFYMLAKELEKEYPDEVKLTFYKGMPILYLTDEENFQYYHRVRHYMTPVTMYRGSSSGYVTKTYDLSKDKIFTGLTTFKKFDPNYVVCADRMSDLFYILANLDSRATLDTRPVKVEEPKTFWGVKMPKMFRK